MKILRFYSTSKVSWVPGQARRLGEASSFGPAPLRCAVRVRPGGSTGRFRPVARWHGGSAVAALEQCQVVSIIEFPVNGQKFPGDKG